MSVEAQWHSKFNELAAKYKGSQSDLKRFTRVAQEHAAKNQQLQEAYLKLKTELERQHVLLSESKRAEREHQNDQKLHDEKYRMLSSEFQKKRLEEQEQFQDQIEKMRETAQVEMKRASYLQKQHKKETDRLKEDLARLEEIRAKERRAYEMKMAEMETDQRQRTKILNEEKQALISDVEEWKEKNQKLQALVKMNDQDSKLERSEKEIEELLASKKQMQEDLEIACTERDAALVKLEAEKLSHLTDRKTLTGKVQISQGEAKSIQQAYEKLHEENRDLHRHNIALGNRVVDIERQINEKHKELLNANRECKTIQEVADKRVSAAEKLANQRIDEILVQLDAKEKTIAQLLKERDALRADIAYNKRNHAEAMRRAEDKLTSETGALQREYDSYVNRLDEMKEKAAEKIAALEDKTKRLQETQDDRLNDIQHSKATISKLNEQLEKMHASSEQSHKDLDLNIKELQETQQELEILQARHRDLQGKEHRLSATLQATSSEVTSLREKLITAKGQISQLHRALKANTEKQKQSTERMTRELQALRAKSKSSIEVLQETVAKLTKDKKKLKKIIMILRVHVREAAIGREQMEKANDVVLETKAMELEMVKSQLRDVERERDDLKRRRITEATSPSKP